MPDDLGAVWVAKEAEIIRADAVARLPNVDLRTFALITGLSRLAAALEFAANCFEDGQNPPMGREIFCAETNRFWAGVAELAEHNAELCDSRLADNARHFTHVMCGLLSEMPAHGSIN